MNDGRSIAVPHLEHIGAFTYPVAVEDDQGTMRILPARNISSLTIPTDAEEGK